MDLHGARVSIKCLRQPSVPRDEKFVAPCVKELIVRVCMCVFVCMREGADPIPHNH